MTSHSKNFKEILFFLEERAALMLLKAAERGEKIDKAQAAAAAVSALRAAEALDALCGLRFLHSKSARMEALKRVNSPKTIQALAVLGVDQLTLLREVDEALKCFPRAKQDRHPRKKKSWGKFWSAPRQVDWLEQKGGGDHG